MDLYQDLLARAVAALDGGADLDGTAARAVLLLAVYAGTGRTGGVDADWDLYTAAIIDAEQRLQADLDRPVLLVEGLPSLPADDPALRTAVIDAVRRLADLYAAGAASGRGTPWRRLVWADVAHRLDDAAAELTQVGTP